MKPYQVVIAETLEDLMTDVNAAIADGYMPIGGLYVNNYKYYPLREDATEIRSYYCQSMFKKPAKKTKPQSSKYEYPEWFEELWKWYPKRAGSNPKQKAWQAINARCILGKVPPEAIEGVLKYAKFCDETHITGTGYVMQACRFFGPNKEYENDWSVPTLTVKLPGDDSMLEAFAVEHGMHEPGKAPANLRNSYEYRKWIEGKL